MGSKIQAKRILTEPKYAKVVPVIPGYNGPSQDDATFLAEAEKIGYPILLKASAGGGGKGISYCFENFSIIRNACCLEK